MKKQSNVTNEMLYNAILALTDALTTNGGTTKVSPKKKAVVQPSSKSTTTTTTTKGTTKGAVDWSKCTPKKDADGQWNYKSYKAARNRYLAMVGKDYDSVGWQSAEDYAKAVAPFEKKFGKYVAKANR